MYDIDESEWPFFVFQVLNYVIWCLHYEEEKWRKGAKLKEKKTMPTKDGYAWGTTNQRSDTILVLCEWLL